jgi:mannitol-1-phosphate 5-dehydrogenase
MEAMKAVMYGAGNIGRGFLGQLFYESGYHTVFVDVNDELIGALNRRGSYPLRLLDGGERNDLLIGNASAVHGGDTRAVAEAIASADLTAVSVGAHILPRIAGALAAGLAERYARGGKPLDILICENLKNAGQTVRGLLREHLPEPVNGWCWENVGLVETSIGRMVPIQTPELQDGDPLRICVEPYKALPADRDAFRAGIPHLQGLVAFSPFSFYVERKLYIHNMGHALAAYAGDSWGLAYIWQAIAEPQIRRLVRDAMRASAEALAKRYHAGAAALYEHVDDLVKRFANRKLEDTAYRVGRDLKRKLAPEDRMVGALRMCTEAGTDTSGIAKGIALALRFSHEALNMPPEQALVEICGIRQEEPVFAEIMTLYKEERIV